MSNNEDIEGLEKELLDKNKQITDLSSTRERVEQKVNMLQNKLRDPSTQWVTSEKILEMQERAREQHRFSKERREAVYNYLYQTQENDNKKVVEDEIEELRVGLRNINDWMGALTREKYDLEVRIRNEKQRLQHIEREERRKSEEEKRQKEMEGKIVELRRESKTPVGGVGPGNIEHYIFLPQIVIKYLQLQRTDAYIVPPDPNKKLPDLYGEVHENANTSFVKNLFGKEYHGPIHIEVVDTTVDKPTRVLADMGKGMNSNPPRPVIFVVKTGAEKPEDCYKNAEKIEKYIHHPMKSEGRYYKEKKEEFFYPAKHFLVPPWCGAYGVLLVDNVTYGAYAEVKIYKPKNGEEFKGFIPMITIKDEWGRKKTSGSEEIIVKPDSMIYGLQTAMVIIFDKEYGGGCGRDLSQEYEWAKSQRDEEMAVERQYGGGSKWRPPRNFKPETRGIRMRGDELISRCQEVFETFGLPFIPSDVIEAMLEAVGGKVSEHSDPLTMSNYSTYGLYGSDEWEVKWLLRYHMIERLEKKQGSPETIKGFCRKIMKNPCLSEYNRICFELWGKCYEKYFSQIIGGKKHADVDMLELINYYGIKLYSEDFCRVLLTRALSKMLGRSSYVWVALNDVVENMIKSDYACQCGFSGGNFSKVGIALKNAGVGGKDVKKIRGKRHYKINRKVINIIFSGSPM